MRYSGIYQEDNFLIDGNPGSPSDNIAKTIADYVLKAKAIQGNGQVPMLMMPLNPTYESGWPNNLAAGATKVALLVKGVNAKLVTDGYQPVLHWLYPNEPNLAGGSHNFSASTMAQDIHDYIVAFHNAVYGPGNTCWNAAWGTPIFVGPDLAYFQNNFYSPGTGLMDKLCDASNNYINSTCIFPYIDVFSWHYYPFGDESKVPSGVPANDYFLQATRSNVVKVLRNKIQFANNNTQDYSFTDELDYMLNTTNGKLTLYNSASGRNVTVCINEANICHKNDISNANSFTGGDAITGTGANSFLGGQFWADLMALCMEKKAALNFWSSMEGCNGANCPSNITGYKTNVGFLNVDPSKFGGVGGKKSSYHHFKMVADNFKGTLLATSCTAGNYKAFSYKNTALNEVGVLLMNQDQTFPAGPDYGKQFRINLDGTTPSITGINVNVAAALPASAFYQCYIKAETTILLKFNAATGALISRTEYSIEDNRNDTGPKTWLPPSQPDAYIRDTYEDDGNQPNPGDPWQLVDGIDVWVRNSPDQAYNVTPKRFANEHVHQNVNYVTTWNAQPSTRPRIYAKVRNRGCSAVTGKVHLYYVKAGLNSIWPTNWKEIFDGDANGNGVIEPNLSETAGTAHDISIQAGEEQVIEVVWNNTADPNDFFQPQSPGLNEWCLLARFDDGNDPIITSGPLMEQSGIQAGWNAQKQNNIVQKNVIFQCPGCKCFWIDFGNSSPTQTTRNRMDLIDMSPNQNFIGEAGEVVVELGQTIYEAWVQGGKTGSGIKDGQEKYLHVSPSGHTHSHADSPIDRNPYQIKVTGKNAYLDNILLQQSQLMPTCVSVNHFTTALSYVAAENLPTEPQAFYPYSMRQSESINTLIPTYQFTGAEKFYIEPVNCSTVSAGQNITIGRFCSATLQASPQLRGATYTWREDLTGQLVGTGVSVIVSPTITTVYEVEKTDIGNCYSYSTVTVTVSNNLVPDATGANPTPCLPGLRVANNSSTNAISDVTADGILFNAFPNPFNDNLTVTYSLPKESKNGSLKIYEVASGKLIYLNELSPSKNKLDINLDVSQGLYICHIIADDGTSKQFKVVKIK